MGPETLLLLFNWGGIVFYFLFHRGEIPKDKRSVFNRYAKKILHFLQ